MNKNKLTKVLIEDIEKYQNNKLKFKDLCVKYSVSIPTMYKYFNDNGIERKLTISKNMVKHDFFDEINTEEKAYVLGLYISDGSIHKGNIRQGYKLNFSLSSIDVDILIKIKNILSPRSNITYSDKRINKYGILTNSMSKLTIFSKNIVNTLDKYGYGTKKTYLEKTIKKVVPDNLMYHFIRGYFDGDGNINHSKVNKEVKLKNYESNNFSFSIISKDKQILSDIEDFLIKEGFKVNNSISKNWFVISINKKDNIIKLYEKLYENSNIYIDRKHKKFSNIIKYIKK